MSEIKSLPAPTKGWNTVDSIANVPSDMAITLDNLIPATGFVTTRLGCTQYVKPAGSTNVDYLGELSAGSISKFICATGGHIYDITNPAAPASLAAGFTSDKWNSTVYAAQIALVNGVDTPQVYNGTTVGAMTVSGPADITKILWVITYKYRTYFGIVGSQSFWYSPLNTLGHALTEFPLGLIGNFGGNLIGAQTLTQDGGTGQDDNICFYMSTGEVIVYSGTDPGTNFVLIGIFKSGRPITQRAIQKFGPDIISVTNEGFQTASALLPLSFGKTNSDINQYIKGAASTAVQAYSQSFGWQAIIAPVQNFMMVNVPQASNKFHQYVLNVNTMAWCRFTNFNARCWGIFGNDLYFGSTDGYIYKYGGLTDNIAGAGSTKINCSYLSPYPRLGGGTVSGTGGITISTGGMTRFTAFRPNLQFDYATTVTVKTSTDYKPYGFPYSITYQPSGAFWGDPWGSFWSGTGSFLRFLNLTRMGYSLSVSLNMTSNGNIKFFMTDFVIEQGDRI